MNVLRAIAAFALATTLGNKTVRASHQTGKKRDREEVVGISAATSATKKLRGTQSERRAGAETERSEYLRRAAQWLNEAALSED